MRDKIKGRRLNWAEVGATRFSDLYGVAIVNAIGELAPTDNG